MTFGERLKELRIEKGLTQNELGKIFNMQRERLSQYETNKRQVDDKTKILFAEYFKVSIDYMLGRTNIKNYELNIDSEILELLNCYKNIQILRDVNKLTDTIKQEVIDFIEFKRRRLNA